jgi:prevent-host-death family protein
MVMKSVSIQALKAQLSSAVASAAAGATLLITRHNAPVAVLGPPHPPTVHRGRRVGTARLKPALSGRPTKGRYLDVLLQDRGER